MIPQTLPQEQATTQRNQMNIVIVGHVDHGKSTVIGRLLADTGSLPTGKLEAVKAMCARNARPFEYAFLLDALKNEQAQGITIDTARCFFKTARRNYILNDAPGHIEFLKNMVTGAARAEAALLVIDAEEGIQENSKRHGYMISMLGIRQISVLVNKMDLAGYSQERFESIRREYTEFLDRLDVHPVSFIPLSAREGVNMTTHSPETPWYDGPTVLEQVDDFEKAPSRADAVFRMPVQDIYKFTAQGDDRRIVAGTIETGSIRVGDRVVFLPSGKRSTIKSIETFNAPRPEAVSAGSATGFTLTEQIYIKPGELMCRAEEGPARVGTRFRANLFWMGRAPLIKGKSYKLKIGAARVAVQLADILSVLDASELSSVEGKQQVDRHDVGECILESLRPVAFDIRREVEPTGRFVIVDGTEIAGAGIILEVLDESASVFRENVRQREFTWEKGVVTPADRMARNNHTGKFIVVNGPLGSGKREIAMELERRLFARSCSTYYLGIANLFGDLDQDEHARTIQHDQQIERLGTLARVMTDAGLLLITTLTDVDDYDLVRLKTLNAPNELFVVNLGENHFSQFRVDVQLPETPDAETAVRAMIDGLFKQNVLFDYSI